LIIKDLVIGNDELLKKLIFRVKSLRSNAYSQGGIGKI